MRERERVCERARSKARDASVERKGIIDESMLRTRTG
jgi:hypothetical protein